MEEGDPLYFRLDGTVTGGDGVYEITGEAGGDMGNGTFRMNMPSEAPFGRQLVARF